MTPIARLVGTLVVLGTSAVQAADPQAAAKAQRPDPLIFSDDFQTDRRSQYQLAGPVDWERGRLTLGPGGSLHREVAAGRTGQVTLDLEWPPLDREGQAAQAEVSFVLDDGGVAAIRLIRRRRPAGSVMEVRVVQTVRQRGGLTSLFARQTVTTEIRRFAELPDFQDGPVRIVYRHGLLRVFHRDKSVAVGEHEVALGGPIQSIGLACLEGRLRCRQWELTFHARSKTPVLSPDHVRKVIESHRTDPSSQDQPLLDRLVAMGWELSGDDVAAYAASLHGLVHHYQYRGDYAQAERLCLRACDVLRATAGADHPAYAVGLNTLALLYATLGNDAKAESLLLQVRDINHEVLGEDNARYAVVLNNLAQLADQIGDARKAESLLLQAQGIYRRVLPANDLKLATNLNNLAGLYLDLGDFSKAEPLYRQAADIVRASHGEDSTRYASVLNNLGGFYAEAGDPHRAAALFRQACDVRNRTLGPEHPDYAHSLNNVGWIHVRMGKYAQAEPVCRQARDIFEKKFGRDHLDYALGTGNLARSLGGQEDFAQAESLGLEAGEIRKRLLGEAHPDCLISLRDLAILHFAQGDTLRALEAARREFRLRVELAEQTVAWLPEARSMAFVRDQPGPDLLLSILRRWPQAEPAESCAVVWSTRALVARTLAQRRWQLADLPEAGETLSQLQAVQQQLAQLTLAVPPASQRDTRQKRLGELNEEKERLEKKLGELSGDYRRWRRVREAGPSDLARMLPDGTAIVQFYEVGLRDPARRWSDTPQDRREYEAFVLRRNTDDAGCRVAWIHLGPVAPIDRAVAQWRAAIVPPSGRPDDAPASAQSAWVVSQELRRSIWEKFEPHLTGCATVVVIPDGGLSFMPWSALPGKRPGSYLIEDYAIATINHGQQLYDLLQQPRPSRGGLLLVGGVDYAQQKAGTPAAHAPPTALVGAETPAMRAPVLKRAGPWRFLDGTAAEVQAIQRLWKGPAEPALLIGTAAHETALRRHLPRSEYVHLATHGFFASPEFRSMFGHDLTGEQLFGGGSESLTARLAGVTMRNPLILSGVVLAGANLPPNSDSFGLPTGEDGILTAEEIVNLDLRNTALVTLSACDTGLGSVAGGEGVLGLQRAFHLAGARSVIASLWRVDDQATRALMVEFYRNLWQRKMGTLEALRQAQIWMLREGRQLNLASLQEGRGPQFDDPRSLPEGSQRLPLRYWAAFLLSGDWR